MNDVVKEWVAKAEGDFDVARLLMRVRKNPNFDSICFHAQQHVEKLLKAALIHRRAIPPKTHDLTLLSEMLAKACLRWDWPPEELRVLTRGAVTYRYPGEQASKEDATETMAITRRVRKRLLTLFT